MPKSVYTFSLPDSGGAPFTLANNTMVWALECIASRALRLHRAVAKGGDAGSNVIVQRLARHAAVGTPARTAIASERSDPDMAAAPGFGFVSSLYAGGNPAPNNGLLEPFVYNAQGGMAEFNDEQGILLRGATSLGLHHDTGTPGVFVSGGAWAEV